MESQIIYPGRNLKHVTPQEEWHELIAIYLYLAGMGAGSFIIGTLIHWFDAKFFPSTVFSINLLGYTLNLTKIPIFWGPILVALSAPCLVLDLGIKRRFLYACLNPKTSWVARGFLILSVFIIFGLMLLARSILPFKWLHGESLFWLSIEIVTFLFGFGTALYTGILLKATRSIPLWNTYLLPLLFLISALSTGSMAIILSTLGSGLFPPHSDVLKLLMRLEQIFILIEGIILYLFLFQRYHSAEQGKDSVRLLLWGEKRVIFWGGIVLLGFIFPIILEAVTSFSNENTVLIVMAGISLLCGGFFLRLGILRAGIKERIPMHRLMEIQYMAMKALYKASSEEKKAIGKSK